MSTGQDFAEANQLLASLTTNAAFVEGIDLVAIQIAAAFRQDNHLYCAGNGGSLADAAHFAEELSGKFSVARRPLPAIAFTDAAHLTCVANDFGFEHVFARMVTAFVGPGDILLLLTTSGNSQNLIESSRAAKVKGACSIAFGGRGGGKLRPEVDTYIDFPGQTSDRIQELQMLALHAITGEIERLLGFTSNSTQ